jgi:RecB family endonuclease NucS
MRMVVATCTVDYAGRLSAHLPEATRLLVVKADGTDPDPRGRRLEGPELDVGALPARRGARGAGRSRGRRASGSTSRSPPCTPTSRPSWAPEPGLTKTHGEAEIQQLLAASCDCIEAGLRLVRREHPTPIGPVDLLCLDEQGGAVAVEVKRVGDIDGVEQLTRYLRYLERDGSLRSVRGIYVAGTVKPQARTLAEDRGIACVEVDFDVLAARRLPDLTLFEA